jgi:ribosomal protein S18 acetylase RimI-like enzyme
MCCHPDRSAAENLYLEKKTRRRVEGRRLFAVFCIAELIIGMIEIRCKFMITIEPITPQNALAFKAARLRALQDTPSAFGSTYAKESKLTDADWIERANRWNGEKSILYMAKEAGTVCAIAGSLLDAEDVTRAQLISMWTAPTHRQRGIGRLLVNVILDWARPRGARTLQLLVTNKNQPAIDFYQRMGFTLTGRTEPYPNDPALLELEMSRPVG